MNNGVIERGRYRFTERWAQHKEKEERGRGYELSFFLDNPKRKNKPGANISGIVVLREKEVKKDDLVPSSSKQSITSTSDDTEPQLLKRVITSGNALPIMSN